MGAAAARNSPLVSGVVKFRAPLFAGLAVSARVGQQPRNSPFAHLDVAHLHVGGGCVELAATRAL